MGKIRRDRAEAIRSARPDDPSRPPHHLSLSESALVGGNHVHTEAYRVI